MTVIRRRFRFAVLATVFLVAAAATAVAARKDTEPDDICPPSVTEGDGPLTVVLDAGHGGHDPGAKADSTGQLEKDAALDIARGVRDYLLEAGLRVLMTRDGDCFIDLKGPDSRPQRAAEGQGDLFVSIHLNSSTKPTPQGVNTYAFDSGRNPGAPGARHVLRSQELAKQIQKALVGATDAVPRVENSKNFAVLRGSDMPAVLVECGFLSNGDESAKLASEEYRMRIAEGIADGILAWTRPDPDNDAYIWHEDVCDGRPSMPADTPRITYLVCERCGHVVHRQAAKAKRRERICLRKGLSVDWVGDAFRIRQAQSVDPDGDLSD